MNWDVILLAALVFAARLCDVALGTLRHALVVGGHRGLVWLIAFLESLVWVFAISRVITNISQPAVAIAFALGFASGTFVGMTVERFIKLGEQVVRIFTTQGDEVARRLRERGHRVTQFEGRGRDGRVDLLFIQVARRKAAQAVKDARAVDACCFYVIDDVRAAAVGRQGSGPATPDMQK